MKSKFVKILIFVLIAGVLTTLVYIGHKHLEEKRKMEEFADAMEAYYDAKVEQFGEENKSIVQGEIEVAFIGDSLTDGYDLGVYYPDLKTANRGIGGDTTLGLEKRLQVSLYDIQPKVVVMLIGANNLGSMFDNYEDILIGLRENLPNSRIVLVSLTSMGREWGRNNHLAAYNNAKIKSLAKKYSYEFVDVYTPLLNVETGEIFEEYTTDGGHLTHEGYLVMTAQIRPVIDKLLEEK